MNNSIIRFVLAILLLVCVFDTPYGHNYLVIFLGFVGFAYRAYDASKGHKNNEVIIFIALAVLFQPFLKIALG